jgi:F0F1-type ATP synthase gamma subunit
VIVEKLRPIDSFQDQGEGGKLSMRGSYLYETDEGELPETLLPKLFEIQPFWVLLESPQRNRLHE